MVARDGECKPPHRRGEDQPRSTRRSASTDPWCVYIVRCADDTLYTGVTNRLEARVDAHNGAKGARYTRSRRPVHLVWSLPCEDRRQALSLEYAIKRLPRCQKQVLIAAAGRSRRGVASRLLTARTAYAACRRPSGGQC